MTKCYRCSAELEADTLWCKACECYQEVAGKTSQCSKCGMYSPVSAKNCLSCNASKQFSLPTLSTTSKIVTLIGAVVGTWIAIANFNNSTPKASLDSELTFDLISLNEKTQLIEVQVKNAGHKDAIFRQARFIYDLPDQADIAETLVLTADASRFLSSGSSILKLEPNGVKWVLRSTLLNIDTIDKSAIDTILFDKANKIKANQASRCRLKIVANESDDRPADQELPITENCNKFLRAAYGYPHENL